MTQLKWNLCCEVLPEKDGNYLTAYKDAHRDEIYDVVLLSFVAGDGGGWNCSRFPDGIHSKHRITNVYAWADCLDAFNKDIFKKERRR